MLPRRWLLVMLVWAIGMGGSGCKKAEEAESDPGGKLGNPEASKQPAKKLAEPPGGYAELEVIGDIEVLGADRSVPNTLLRPGKADTLYRLSNPRMGRAKRFPRPMLEVDYKVLRVGAKEASNLVIRSGSGKVHRIAGPPKGRNKGTFRVQIRGAPWQKFPENMEMYLARTDHRYGKRAPTYKVSNSVTLGKMAELTRMRNWTKEEIARLSSPPPNHSNPNAHPGVGRDTQFAGKADVWQAKRYVDPDGFLLGVDYFARDFFKEKCVWRLIPVFERDQEKSGFGNKRVMAKKGYAVGGAKVYSQKHVDGIQLVFMKVGPDGKLDPTDSYSSAWLGFTVEGQEPTVLAGDGTRVIGLYLRQGAMVDGLALVLAE